jgi:hypothetical protein
MSPRVKSGNPQSEYIVVDPLANAISSGAKVSRAVDSVEVVAMSY